MCQTSFLFFEFNNIIFHRPRTSIFTRGDYMQWLKDAFQCNFSRYTDEQFLLSTVINKECEYNTKTNYHVILIAYLFYFTGT